MKELWTVLADRYERVSPLGEGGNGTVFLAKDRNLEIFVAVKAAVKDNPQAVEALVREREVLKGLCHPGIPRVLDFREGKEHFFLVTEWAKGKNLKEICSKECPELGQIWGWILELLKILEYLERQSPPLIHGDLKPEHLIASAEGRLMLVDFGSAFWLGQNPSGHGTEGYAAPELYPEEGQTPGIASDLYSLGASLAKLVSGRKLPWVWTYIIWKCMRKNPDKRWKNAGFLRHFLIAGKYFHTIKV
ncbi:serine/threonine protein kinase [Hominifimenecus sp. rT4P-3]|uniref:serine/threonine protein kinase n=1 Tax=Hominifimenecus sp. rT4P-3 TaxID=3242979 RepID=UPI003DA4C4A0